jgi:hypothetical protein
MAGSSTPLSGRARTPQRATPPELPFRLTAEWANTSDQSGRIAAKLGFTEPVRFSEITRRYESLIV